MRDQRSDQYNATAGLVSRLLRYHGPTTTATAALPIFRCWPILGHCMQNSAILVQTFLAGDQPAPRKLRRGDRLLQEFGNNFGVMSYVVDIYMSESYY